MEGRRCCRSSGQQSMAGFWKKTCRLLVLQAARAVVREACVSCCHAFMYMLTTNLKLPQTPDYLQGPIARALDGSKNVTSSPRLFFCRVNSLARSVS